VVVFSLATIELTTGIWLCPFSMNQTSSPSIWKSTGLAPIWSFGRICHWVMTPAWNLTIRSFEEVMNQVESPEVRARRAPLIALESWVVQVCPVGVVNGRGVGVGVALTDGVAVGV